MEGDSCTGDFEEKVSFRGMCRKRLWKWVSLSVGALLGNLGRGSLFTGNFER
jgi:hypothetical protein